MFTGIIKGLGTVKDVARRDEFLDITIDVEGVLDSTEIGASVAVDGVCLTITETNGPDWKFSVMQETLDKTTIGERKAGDRVDLEQPMKMGDEFGGHLVLGHVDGVGTIVKKEIIGENCWVSIETSESLAKYLVQKGSIAIDGISLTVCDPINRIFSVSLLPLTLSLTTLGHKQVGDRVNLEADYFLKAMVR